MRKFVFGVMAFLFLSTVSVYAGDRPKHITSGLSYFHTLTTEEKESVHLLFFDAPADIDTEDPVAHLTEEDMLTVLADLVSRSDIEVTFDATRAVTGRTFAGTKLRAVNFVEIDEQLDRQFENEVIVGASGVFSLSLDLDEGDNVIALIFEREVDTTIVVSSIRRMPENVKLELGNSARTLSGLNNVLFGEN